MTIAALVPRHYDPEDAEKGYNEWFGAQIQEALDSDPATDLNDEDVEKHFAKLRDASQLKLQGIPK